MILSYRRQVLVKALLLLEIDPIKKTQLKSKRFTN